MPDSYNSYDERGRGRQPSYATQQELGKAAEKNSMMPGAGQRDLSKPPQQPPQSNTWPQDNASRDRGPTNGRPNDPRQPRPAPPGDEISRRDTDMTNPRDTHSTSQPPKPSNPAPKPVPATKPDDKALLNKMTRRCSTRCPTYRSRRPTLGLNLTRLQLRSPTRDRRRLRRHRRPKRAEAAHLMETKPLEAAIASHQGLNPAVRMKSQDRAPGRTNRRQGTRPEVQSLQPALMGTPAGERTHRQPNLLRISVGIRCSYSNLQ